MMRELDDAIFIDNKREAQYLIPESVYEHDHPDVIYYTQYFLDRSKKNGDIFVNIDRAIKNNRSFESAEKIAGIWSEFSKFVPSFIAKAVSLTTDPEHQYHLIQIAYDELGAQNKDLIHSKLFLNALDKADIKPVVTSASSSIRKMLFSLATILERVKSPSGIIGLLLSFEIIAEDNIETIFRGLSFDNLREKIFSESLFFKIHRTNEIEHIRHSIANFLRFSKTREEIEEAKEFFDVGITFWKNFWDKIAEVLA